MSIKQAFEIIVKILNTIPLPLQRQDWHAMEKALLVIGEYIDKHEAQDGVRNNETA